MLNDRDDRPGIFAAVTALVFVIIVYFMMFSQMGCSISLIRVGGEDVHQTQYRSDHAVIDAWQDTAKSIEDSIKDLADLNYKPAPDLPGGGVLVTPPNSGMTEDDNTPPDTSAGTLQPMPAGFCWKPVSESDGNLVVLTPAEIEGASLRTIEADGNDTLNEFSTRAIGVNGGRQHWRFDQPGSGFRGPVQVTLTTSGLRFGVTIPDPAKRFEL